LGIQLVDYTQKFTLISKKNKHGAFTNYKENNRDDTIVANQNKIIESGDSIA
jgi:hypothetical protein